MPEATRVLYLLDYTRPGGGETSFLALMDHALAHWPGFEPLVALPEPGSLGPALERMGIQVRILGWPRRYRLGPLPWFSLPAAGRVHRLVRNFRPHVIHALHVFGLLYAGPAARLTHTPVLWTCHGWYDIDNKPKQWTARHFADRIAAVSESVAREADHRLGQPGRAQTDYLGILPFDGPTTNILRDEVRHEMGIQPGQPLIAVVGRFQPIKGHRYLLDALPAIRRRIPDLRVWFIGDALFGGEEDACKADLVRRIREEGLADCVTMLGFHPDARRLMRALDALVIPSEAESFGMAAVEGLEAGIPVVGPDCWGPREIIDAPATGRLFKPCDAEDLARCIIETLTTDGPGAGFDPQAGPARVASLFTVAAHARRTLDLYHQLNPAIPAEADNLH